MFGVAGESEKCVAVEDAGVGLEESVGAEAVLVDPSLGIYSRARHFSIEHLD